MAPQPFVRGPGLLGAPGDVETHRRLDMVPWVGVAAGKPGDLTAGGLRGGDEIAGLSDRGRVEYRVGPRHAVSSDLAKYTTRLLPTIGLSSRSGNPGPPRPAHDVVDEHPMVEPGKRARRRCRARTGNAATSTASAVRVRGGCPPVRATRHAVATSAAGAGRCARARPRPGGTRPTAPSRSARATTGDGDRERAARTQDAGRLGDGAVVVGNVFEHLGEHTTSKAPSGNGSRWASPRTATALAPARRLTGQPHRDEHASLTSATSSALRSSAITRPPRR